MNRASSTRFGLCIALLATMPLIATAADNPVTYMIGVNDCDVLKYNGEYYLSGNWLAGDMLASTDLRSWGRRTHVFSYDNSWHAPLDPADPDKDIHGTHLRYDNGLFHLYAHLEVADGIAHAVSDDVWGPYAEPVDAPFAQWIDADTFRDDDGALHFYSTRIVAGQERIYRRPMSAPDTLTGWYDLQLAPGGGWEGSTSINEGSKVFKHRGRYFMLYNAYATTDPDYAIGCAAAADPAAFSNSGKYADAVLRRAAPGPGSDEIAYIGQPWVVEGPNGLEHWLGYFGQSASEGRTQRIDRLHFFDKTLFVDGPTNRYALGYHPGPAQPQYLGLFDGPPNVAPAGWTRHSGAWVVQGGELRQIAPGAASATLDATPATCFLFEVNLRLTSGPVDQQAGARVYYADDDNWLIVGLHQTADPGSDNFYCHLREGGVDRVEAVALTPTQCDMHAYHKLRIERNGPRFSFQLDDRVFSPVDNVTAPSFGPGRVGLFANDAVAAFDGAIYCVGWDEHDAEMRGWGAATSGVAATGAWSVGPDGLTQADPAGGQAFKGDLMPTYEFSVQATALDDGGAMGCFPVAIDPNNYLLAAIDRSTHQLFVEGAFDGAAIAAPPNVSVAPADSYNLRAVKLADRVILFVDGAEKMTVPASFGPSQVGLVSVGVAARFNGVLVYQTEPHALAAPWSLADVGNVGFPGAARAQGDAFFLTASGADIWTAQDSFTFVQQPVTGDIEITARVRHHGVTDWWQKAGVMIRESLDPNAPHVSVVLSAVDAHAGNATFCSRIWREQPGYPSGAADLTVATNNQPHWVRIKRTDDLFAGYSSLDGENWTAVGDPVAPAMDAAAHVGLVLTAHNNDRITDAVFDRVCVLAPLPQPWRTENIGAPAPAGRASAWLKSEPGVEIEAGGAEICCSADEFRYDYQELPGDGSIVARVVSLEDTGPRAKAGVMIREDLAPGARHFAVELHAAGALGTNRRLVADTGSGEEYAPGTPFVPPYWLRLTRADGAYACEMSPDGESWSTVAGPYDDIFAGQPAYVGLIACANAAAETCTARFDCVHVARAPRSTDVDADGDVDLHDAAQMQTCFTGGSAGVGEACAPCDFDYSDAVDVADAQRLLDCFYGPSAALPPECGG